ncbi:hypothetical protein [Candidatus Halobonum tyrrellensis]|uniref:Uncharacterized protein n=1 Tax=Candidatus Halobonum tyrrellensis G22 TaxID=1324957 RepID=V4GXD7_9EURY|nr:hypothetical protein [Candidatus Halobonum tyrrellensis]ESP89801.1 hypothetical protein K933_02421 [Candidatus Halobonum tyrrellensis G22]
MSYRTTAGWSLITSGVLTLALTYAPYPSFYWGIGFLIVGVLLFVTRQII